MRTLLRILSYLRSYKRLVAVGVVSVFGSSLLYLAIPRILGNSIDRILEKGDFTYLVIAGIAVIAISLVRGLFSFFQNYLRETTSQLVAYRIRNEIYDHLQNLSFAYHDKQQTGQLMSRATADVESIRWFINMCVFQMAYLWALLIAASVLLLFADWKLALASLCILPFIMWRAAAVHGRLRNIWAAAQARTGEMTTVLQESMSGVKVVKAFSRKDYEQKKFSVKAQAVAGEQLNAAKVQASNTPFIAAAFTGIIIMVLWFGGHRVLNGQMTPGELAQFVLYLSMLQQPVRMTGFMINMATRAVSSGERIFEILDVKSPVDDKPGARVLASAQGRVTFENVSFSYGREPVLKDIQLDVQPGHVVALLGPTGSGKSSMVHLIPRFYDVTAGRVLFDGVDVRDIQLASLRRNVGIVQQDVFLFSDTIRNNIAYGSVDATQERVEWAAKTANLHKFILSQPLGYQTWVGERGVTLSGGQKQRLAIARTLLIDPRVLVLDDSTSSVDTRTEFEIRQALAAVMRDRTTFVIAHRLSTAKSADLILVLDHGMIVQRGTHEELVAASGPYRDIYEMQLRPQEDAGMEERLTATLSPAGSSGGVAGSTLIPNPYPLTPSPEARR